MPNLSLSLLPLHLVEHIPDPQKTSKMFLMLWYQVVCFVRDPHPEYSLRRFKDRDTDAIGKDKTHINCHVPATWKQWSEEAGFTVLKQFGDGLWDVPYYP